MPHVTKPRPIGDHRDCVTSWLIRWLGVFCLSTGAWLGHALSKWHCHDLGLWQSLHHLLEKGDVLVGDAGFCAYALMAELKERGVDTVLRQQGGHYEAGRGK